MCACDQEESRLPLVATVDIVIVGDTSVAVSFALAAKRAGVSVYVVSSRPYMGEDICGLYRFWPESCEGDSLSDLVFPAAASSPPTPMHVKLTLEQSLVQADIPFIFNCFSAGILRTEEGVVQGVAIANRTGVQAIRARVVVDATLNGMVLRQAGHAGSLHSLKGVQQVEYTTLCEGEGSDATGVADVTRLPGYKTERYSLSARRYLVSVDCGDGSPVALADAYSELVDRCRVSGEYRHQTRILPLLPASDAIPTVDALQVEENLYGLSESLRLPEGAEVAFSNPISAMRLGRMMGSQIAAGLPAAAGGDLRVVCSDNRLVRDGDLHMLRDALRPEAGGNESVAFDVGSLPLLARFDVVVVGGGTGGAPAAISASRSGASTLVVELTSGLGGVATMGQIAKYWHGNRVGFTSEIDQGVNRLEHKEDLKTSTDSWSVAAKNFWYHKTGREAGCTYWFNTLCAGVCVSKGRVTAILVAGPYGYGLVEAGCVVDSTGCSDVPAIAGAPTIVVGKNHIAVQGTGLAGQNPGREYHNSDHNFSDDTDVIDATAILTAAKLKFKEDFDCSELVDSRERRQIVGDYSINSVDILFNRTFPDTICLATSNFDSHGFTIDPVFMLKPSDKSVSLWANIPLRCLLPRGLDGVLVTGLGISAHRDALPVIRMQPDVQNQGYAAGYIAALSARTGKAIRELDIRSVQEHLIEIGNLPQSVLTATDSFPLSDDEVYKAVSEGWDSLSGMALILSQPERSAPVMRQAYAELRGERSARSLRYAQLLALLGMADGQAELIERLVDSKWDEGWRFRGMHQFGMTLSEVDKLIICIGAAGDGDAWPAVLEKIETLPQEAEFSHYRAIAMCCEQLYARHPNAMVAKSLAALLLRPGYRGHAHSNIAKVQSALTNDINENAVRDQSLRELHIARALYRCGDSESLGHDTLNTYAADLRGHFSRHARAVLAAQ